MRIKYVIFINILLSSIVTATNYYVAPWGDDDNNGLSWDSAFATLQHAADIVEIIFALSESPMNKGIQRIEPRYSIGNQ